MRPTTPMLLKIADYPLLIHSRSLFLSSMYLSSPNYLLYYARSITFLLVTIYGLSPLTRGRVRGLGLFCSLMFPNSLKHPEHSLCVVTSFLPSDWTPQATPNITLHSVVASPWQQRGQLTPPSPNPLAQNFPTEFAVNPPIATGNWGFLVQSGAVIANKESLINYAPSKGKLDGERALEKQKVKEK